MKRTYHYGFFTGMDPVCPQRVKEYPELAAVRDATPEQRRAMHPGDLDDAQHQWAYGTGVQLMQRCHEEGCDAVRPTPLHGYPAEAQTFILQEFIRRHLPAHA